MPDLNSTMFYKVKFSISPADPKEDLLWLVVRHIQRWQVQKCRKRGLTLTANARTWTDFKRGGRIRAKDGSVYFTSERFRPGGGAQYWACRIVEDIPQRKDMAARRWITEIGYEQDKAGTAVFSCVVSYSDRAGFIGPYQEEPKPSIPNLILNIVDDPALRASFGPDELERVPQKLSAGEWPEFCRRMMNPERQLPYILVSPQVINRAEKTVAFLVDYEGMAKRLFGNAVVFFFDDPDFSQEMAYMNEQYACYGGAVRVYQPGAQEPSRHRYLSADNIEEYGSGNVQEFLVRAFAQNVDFYDTFFCIEECSRKKDEFAREKRWAELREAHKAQLSQVEDDLFRLAEEEAEQAQREQARADGLDKELKEERRKTRGLEAQVEQMRAAAEENGGLRRALDGRNEIGSMPQTVDDVAAYFNRMFGDKLVFLEDAFRSLKDCTIDPAELWDDLFALANTMRELYKSGQGDIYKAFKERTGITVKRGEGAETRKDKALMRQYERTVNGEEISIEAHITYAKQGQSIHFGYSRKLQKVVIGHCGEHLDNYITPKVK